MNNIANLINYPLYQIYQKAGKESHFAFSKSNKYMDKAQRKCVKNTTYLWAHILFLDRSILFLALSRANRVTGIFCSIAYSSFPFMAFYALPPHFL